MRKVKGQDKTFGELYEEIEAQTGIRSPALDGPALPDAGFRLWQWFIDMSRRRPYQVGMETVPQPITFTEMQAYFALTGEQIEPWQRRILARIDDLYLRLATGEADPTGVAHGAAQLKANVINR